MSRETEFGEKLRTALESVDSLVWKDKNGKVFKLMNASQTDLQKWYQHCYEMLYNTCPYNPGKCKIKETIQRAWNLCNTELFVRYIFEECKTQIKTKKDILDYINSQREQYSEDIANQSITVIFNGVPPIYEKVTIGNLLDACFDKLGVLNKKMITDKFILAQGIWLTNEERKELLETDSSGKPKDILEVIKDRLCLNPKVPLRIDSTGLTFSEFRSLVKLDYLPQISSLPTTTLKTLRDKVLLRLDNTLDHQIYNWRTLMNNIEKVAKLKNFDLQIEGINGSNATTKVSD